MNKDSYDQEKWLEDDEQLLQEDSAEGSCVDKLRCTQMVVGLSICSFRNNHLGTSNHE